MTIKIQKALRRTKRVTLDTGKGLTEQSHKKECDMNFILEKYRRTGFINHAKQNQGRYDDISTQDFQEAMFIVKEAENMFAELPGNVRKRFQNNPADFLTFVQNPENKPEMEKLGILRGNDGIDLNGVATNAPVKTPEPVLPTGGTPETPPETPTGGGN